MIRLFQVVDCGFDAAQFAQVLTWANRHSDAAFAEYGVYGRDLDGLRARFAQWRAELGG